MFSFAKASSILCSGGKERIKSCFNKGVDKTDESDLLLTSALMMARNPSAYPVLLRRVEFRTFSFSEISSMRRYDQTLGRDRTSDGWFGLRQLVAICWSASRAANAAPACFRVVSVLSRSCPTLDTRWCEAVYPSVVITEAIAAHVSFVNSQLPTYVFKTNNLRTGVRMSKRDF